MTGESMVKVWRKLGVTHFGRNAVGTTFCMCLEVLK